MTQNDTLDYQTFYSIDDFMTKRKQGRTLQKLFAISMKLQNAGYTPNEKNVNFMQREHRVWEERKTGAKLWLK